MTNSSLPPGSTLVEADLEKLRQLMQAQAKAAAHKIPLLGPVTWLMMQQPMSRHTLLSELDWRVMPPLLLEQAKLYVRDELPLAFASWAKLSADTAKRYRLAPHQLAPSDWKSGDQIWLVDVFTPFGGAAELLKDLRENVFAGQTIYQLGPISEVDGFAEVVKWEAA